MFYEDDDFLIALWPCFLFDLLEKKKKPSLTDEEFVFKEKILIVKFFIFQKLSQQFEVEIDNQNLHYQKISSNLKRFFFDEAPNQGRSYVYLIFGRFSSKYQTWSQFELQEYQETWFNLTLWHRHWHDFQIVTDKALEKGEIFSVPKSFRELFQSFHLSKFFYEWYCKKDFPFSESIFTRIKSQSETCWV